MSISILEAGILKIRHSILGNLLGSQLFSVVRTVIIAQFQHRLIKGHNKALYALNIDRLVRRAGINADAQLFLVHLGHGQACFIVCRCCKSRCDAKAQHHRNYEQSR